jgi:hypothetical protein
MDATNTLQIPRIVVSANDQRRDDDPEATLIVPNPLLARSEPAAESVPAIAQESFTDVVSSPPGIRSRQRRIEDARARQLTQIQQPQQRAEEPDLRTQTQDTADLDDLFQAAQPPTMRSLSQRLDG